MPRNNRQARNKNRNRRNLRGGRPGRNPLESKINAAIKRLNKVERNPFTNNQLVKASKYSQKRNGAFTTVTFNELISVYPPSLTPEVPRIVTYVIGPDTFDIANSRLAPHFAGNEMYHIDNLTVTYIPQVAKTVDGTMHIVPDYDPSDKPPQYSTETDLIRQLSTRYKYKSGPISEKLVVNMSNFKLPSGRSVREDLYTDASTEVRSHNYGQFHMVHTGYEFTKSPGKVYISGTIRFAIPSLKELTPYVSFQGGEGFLNIPHLEDLTSSSSLAGHIADWTSLATDDVGAPSNLRGGNVYKGEVLTDGNEVLYDDGKLVPDGTTVFFRKADRYITDGATVADSIVGEMALDETFTNLISFTAATVTVLKIIHLVVKSLA